MQHSPGGLLHGHPCFTDAKGISKAFPVNFANYLGDPISDADGIANRWRYIHTIAGADTAISTSFSYKNKGIGQEAK